MPRFVFAALAVWLSATISTAEVPKPEGPKTVKTQAEAIQEAKDVDLKLLEKADRVALLIGGHKVGDPINVKGDGVAAFRKALVPKAVRPSGGEQAASITFYQGETPLRTVWIYRGGEWGFDRPGTSWTTGLSDELWKLVGKYDK